MEPTQVRWILASSFCLLVEKTQFTTNWRETWLSNYSHRVQNKEFIIDTECKLTGSAQRPCYAMVYCNSWACRRALPGAQCQANQLQYTNKKYFPTPHSVCGLQI